MPEIGTTLREARMHARIDINEVEQATKIRAKYLRALENEEWSLLPGSTFVKSFLREYADYLGLDSRMLVEEYKLRYERPSENELRPLGGGLANERGRRARGGGAGSGGGFGGGGGGVPRWAAIGAVIVVLLVALYVFGSVLGGGSNDDKSSSAGTTTTSASRTTARHRTAQHRRRPPPPAAPTMASVRIIPRGDVYVCLEDETGRVLIPGTTFTAGQTVPVQRARSMKLTLGNNNVTLRANNHAVPVTASSSAIGYSITTRGVSPLPAGQAPTCQ